MIISVTQKEIDSVKLTKKQEDDLIDSHANWWDERFETVPRARKLQAIKENIARERKELALGVLDHTQEQLDQRLRTIEKALWPKGKFVMNDLHKVIVPPIKQYVSEQVDAIEKRLDELEARPVMIFKGVWDPDCDYERGHVVTDNGSLWSCVDATKRQRPGKSPDWKLIAKAGSAPRDPQ